MTDLESAKNDKLKAIDDRLSAQMQVSEVGGIGNIYPANLALEGSDQHSRWFLCSLVSSVALQGRAPFLALKTHGLVLDETEQKMSKSRPENTIDPEDLILGT